MPMRNSHRLLLCFFFGAHFRPHRLVVRTSRCGRDNPGSTPGEDSASVCWCLTTVKSVNAAPSPKPNGRACFAHCHVGAKCLHTKLRLGPEDGSRSGLEHPPDLPHDALYLGSCPPIVGHESHVGEQWKTSPATLNRTRDHLMAARFYSQML